MSQTLPEDTSIEAEYEDGFVLNETQHNDISPYDPQFNVFRAILNKDPEQEHGMMIRFSVFYKDMRHDINWLDLPDNARPIRFRDRYLTSFPDGSTESGITGCRFGYQFTDENGKNQQFIKEL